MRLGIRQNSISHKFWVAEFLDRPRNRSLFCFHLRARFLCLREHAVVHFPLRLLQRRRCGLSKGKLCGSGRILREIEFESGSPSSQRVFREVAKFQHPVFTFLHKRTLLQDFVRYIDWRFPLHMSAKDDWFCDFFLKNFTLMLTLGTALIEQPRLAHQWWVISSS